MFFYNLTFWYQFFTSSKTRLGRSFNRLKKDLWEQGEGLQNAKFDAERANKAFAEKNNFNFPILGDYNSKTIRDYDILVPDLLHLKDYNFAKRSVFIIDENGIILYKWVSEDPLKEPNYQEIIDFLKKGN